MADCKYGDPFCPCQDGDMCHYEAPNPLPAPDPLRKIYYIATSLAMRTGQTVGDHNEYYVTLGQLERIVMNFLKL